MTAVLDSRFDLDLTPISYFVIKILYLCVHGELCGQLQHIYVFQKFYRERVWQELEVSWSLLQPPKRKTLIIFAKFPRPWEMLAQLRERSGLLSWLIVAVRDHRNPVPENTTQDPQHIQRWAPNSFWARRTNCLKFVRVFALFLGKNVTFLSQPRGAIHIYRFQKFWKFC